MKELIHVCLEGLQECVTACEKCVDACQTFADKCSTQDRQECAKQVGICKNRLIACIEKCRTVFSLANEYMSQSSNPAHIDSLDRTTEVAQECVSACQKAINACDKDFDSCNAATLHVIEVCSRCAKACAQAIVALKQ